MLAVIRKVSEPYGWLGNMSAHPITYEGKEWRTAEALFQAMRFKEPDIIANIWRQKSPMGAKMTAKKHADKMIVRPRSPEDVANMDKILRLKIEQHPGLKKQLIDLGPWVQIVEDCSNRRNDSGLFWGAAEIEGQWVGLNKLGLLWGSINAELHGIT